jgi:hypothetical protein
LRENFADRLSATGEPIQDLVTNRTADDETIVRMAPSSRGIDNPTRAVHESKVLRQVVAELSQAVERDPVPETAGTPASEQSLTLYQGNRTVGRSIACHLDAIGLHHAEQLEASSLAPLRVSIDARVRPRVDQDPARGEDSVDLAQGIDHALRCNSSKCPRQQDHVECRVGIWQSLGRTDCETDVLNLRFAHGLPCGFDALGIGIQPINTRSQRRDAKRETAVATPQIQNAFTADEGLATPFPQLVEGPRPERRRHGRNLHADVADIADAAE